MKSEEPTPALPGPLQERDPQKKVRGLARIGCTDAEIAMNLKLGEYELWQRYADPLQEGRGEHCAEVRRLAFEEALNKNNMTPLGWLFRQDLACRTRLAVPTLGFTGDDWPGEGARIFAGKVAAGEVPPRSIPEALSAATPNLRDLSDRELQRRVRKLSIQKQSRAAYGGRFAGGGSCCELQTVNCELLRRAAESDLAQFFREAWDAVHPGRELIWSWHYDLLCEWLTLVKQRKCRRLIINVPPRTGKSTLATIAFPAWVWATDPGHGFLCASYSRELSTEHSLGRRNLIAGEWYQGLWGDGFALAGDQNMKTQFDNNRGGQMIAASVGGAITGKGGDTVIVDDPLSAGQAYSDAERKAANEWFDHTLRSRLNDPATGAMVVIMQRLHERDLTGYLTHTEKHEWTVVRVPLVEDGEEESSRQAATIGRAYSFPVSGKQFFRLQGDVLQPGRFTPEEVANLQAQSRMFAGQFQQRPAPAEGNLIKLAQVKYYGGIHPLSGEKDEELPDYFDSQVISVDCAFKGLESSDYVAIGRIGIKGRKRFVLNVINARLGFSATEQAIIRERELRTVAAVLVEDAANGAAIVERLKRRVSGVVAVTPKGGKLARFMAMQPEWEAGDWYVARDAAWTAPLVEQLTTFPAGEHDDMCDMLSQAAIWMQNRQIGWVQFVREEVERMQQNRG